MKKKLTLVVSLLLVMALSIGGTLAYLTYTTESITNTFTVGNVKIDLTETFNTDTDGKDGNDAWTGKMVPGQPIAKDPKVTVEAGSEACYLFVKLGKSEGFDTYITSAIAAGWTELTDVSGVYYREQSEVADDVADDELPSYSVLSEDKVTVNTSVTQEMMDAITKGDATKPTLTITAYAVQSAGMADAADAWMKAGF